MTSRSGSRALSARPSLAVLAAIPHSGRLLGQHCGSYFHPTLPGGAVIGAVGVRACLLRWAALVLVSAPLPRAPALLLLLAQIEKVARRLASRAG